jgi:hypothetical protein
VGGAGTSELSLEYSLLDRLSLNGVLGSYAMGSGEDIVGGALYLRRYLPIGKSRLFAEAGAGWFDTKCLDAGPGGSLGLGLNRPLSARWQGELGARILRLIDTSDDRELLTLQIGLRLDL